MRHQSCEPIWRRSSCAVPRGDVVARLSTAFVPDPWAAQMIRPILCGLAQAVYEIILIKVICAVPLGRGLIQADDCPPRSAHSAAGRPFHFKIADRVAARKRGKNRTRCGDENMRNYRQWLIAVATAGVV